MENNNINDWLTKNAIKTKRKLIYGKRTRRNKGSK